MFDRVLVALDGSALGETVLPWVSTLLRRTTAQVWLCHAVAVAPELGWASGYAGFMPAMAIPPSSPVDYEGLGQAYLGRVATGLAAPGRVQAIVRRGEPAHVVVGVAREVDAELIAMSTHGRSGLERLVLGSVADQVLQAGERPVLLIRPDGPALREAERKQVAREG